jgi:hypothetical protein
MAKLQEEVLVIKVSKLLKDTDNQDELLSEEVLQNLEAVMQQLVGAGALIEINLA